MTTGLANAIVGIWLVASAFFWPHTPAQLALSCACGALAGLLGLIGLGLRWVRYVDGMVGLVLVSASFNLRPGHPATLWNHSLCGLAVIAFALFEGVRRALGRGRTWSAP
jgi:hypothetical protein